MGEATTPLISQMNLRCKQVPKELSESCGMCGLGSWVSLLPHPAPGPSGSCLSNLLPRPLNPGHLLLSQVLLLAHQGGDALPGRGHFRGLEEVWLVVPGVRVLLAVILGVGLLPLLLPPFECPA